MLEPEEIEESEEIEPEALNKDPAGEPLPSADFDQEDFTTAARIQSEENLIEPMELESKEPIPRRRGNFIASTLQTKFKQIKLDPKETAIEVGEKTKDIAQDHGATILHHIPGVGFLAALFSKKKVTDEIKNTTKQFGLFDRLRLQILAKQPPRALDYQRGVNPLEFTGKTADLLLANTCEYAQLQLQKRLKKLQVKSLATDLQTIGGGTAASIIGAPIGAGLSATGSIIKAGLSFKSVGNFFRKLFNRTLGVERGNHAKVLFGLALEHLAYDQQIAPPRDLDTVNQALNLIGTAGSIRDRVQARTNAFALLEQLGVAPQIKDPKSVKDFMNHGFKEIMDVLKS